MVEIQFLPDKEPEVSALAKRELQKHMQIITNHEVREAEKLSTGMKKIVAVNREDRSNEPTIGQVRRAIILQESKSLDDVSARGISSTKYQMLKIGCL